MTADPGVVVIDLGVVAAIGGLLALDRRGAFQVMVSQPLVAAPLVGLALGDLTTGLWLGSLLQLLWMSSVLFGATVPPNETLSSVAITGMVMVYGRHFGTSEPQMWAVALLVGTPLALGGRWLEVRLDRMNTQLAERADEAARAGSPGALAVIPPLGLLRALLANAVVVLVSTSVGVGVLLLVQGGAGAPLEYALSLVAVYCVPAVGLGAALALVRRRRGVALAALAYVVMLIVVQPGGGA